MYFGGIAKQKQEHLKATSSTNSLTCRNKKAVSPYVVCPTHQLGPLPWVRLVLKKRTMGQEAQ